MQIQNQHGEEIAIMPAKAERVANRAEKAFLALRENRDAFANCTFDDLCFPSYFIAQLVGLGIPDFDS